VICHLCYVSPHEFIFIFIRQFLHAQDSCLALTSDARTSDSSTESTSDSAVVELDSSKYLAMEAGPYTYSRRNSSEASSSTTSSNAHADDEWSSDDEPSGFFHRFFGPNTPLLRHAGTIIVIFVLATAGYLTYLVLRTRIYLPFFER